MIRHVRNIIHCISSHLKHYQQEVWDLIENFDVLNINPNPHSLNYDTDLLANFSAKLIPS